MKHVKTKLKNLYEEFGAIKFAFYLFLIINAVWTIFNAIDMVLPVFCGEQSFQENILLQNLHLSADSNDTFMDFFNSIQYGRTPYTRRVIYPPLINVIYGFFGKIVPMSIKANGTLAIRASVPGVLVFELFCMMTAVVYAIAIAGIKGYTKKEKWFLGLGLCFTLPAVFCLERGNSVWLCVAFTMIFVNWYDSPKKMERGVAILSLAIAAAIKIYPAAFGLLLIRHKKWKEALEAIIAGVLVMFVPFVFFTKENRSVTLWISNIINCNKEFQNIGLGLKLNLSNTMQFFEALCGAKLSGFTTVLTIAILVFDCVMVAFNRKLDEWKAIALLSLLMILIPGFSWTYTMLFIIIPVVIFLGKDNRYKKDYIYLVLFILCLTLFPPCEQFQAFNKINDGVGYRLGWTTLIESLSLILLQIGIAVDCLKKGRA